MRISHIYYSERNNQTLFQDLNSDLRLRPRSSYYAFYFSHIVNVSSPLFQHGPQILENFSQRCRQTGKQSQRFGESVACSTPNCRCVLFTLATIMAVLGEVVAVSHYDTLNFRCPIKVLTFATN